MGKTRTKVLLKLIEKRGFSPASMVQGGGDPAAAGQPPMGPAAGGQPPMAPAAMPPADPSMGAGMEAAGGQPPMDPATGMPMDPAAQGGGNPMAMPITELAVGDLVQIIGEVIGQALGGGVPPEEMAAGAPQEEMAAPPPEEMAGEPQGEAEGSATNDDDVVSRLDQIIEMLGATMGMPPAGNEAPMQPMGPEAGAMSPEQGPPPGEPKKASVLGGTSIADLIIAKVSEL